MYSVFNVDISSSSSDKSPYVSDFLSKYVNYKSYTGYYIEYSHQSIIRGSSTVNGDSAHSNGKLEQEHNYVSFYVKSIKIRYDISILEATPLLIEPTPGYVILFKLPYKDEETIRNTLLLDVISPRISDMILYTHPENVLIYNVLNLRTKKSHDSGFLNYNKPFIVGPNDYVGIFYFFPHDRNRSINIYNVSATAKVIFKPL